MKFGRLLFSEPNWDSGNAIAFAMPPLYWQMTLYAQGYPADCKSPATKGTARLVSFAQLQQTYRGD